MSSALMSPVLLFLIVVAGATAEVAKREPIRPDHRLADGTLLNLAYNYSPDFHISFAIIAFTTILFTLIIFGVSLGMWFMDPGRDSIIYRMTSQRMKKDQ